MTRDSENARTDNREPHPFWTTEENNKKLAGKTKKGADARTTHTGDPRAELGKRKAP